MQQGSYPSSNFALAVVVHPDGRFLIVQESAKHNFLWWLPGGRVEWGDSMETTCIKETKEEGGLDVEPTRLLKIEFSRGRCRFLYLASPTANPPPEEPKTIPDSESNRAVWTTVEGLANDPVSAQLRGPEPRAWFNYISRGGKTYPLSVVKSSEEDEATLTPEQLSKKKKAVENRTPHATVAEIETDTYLYSKNPEKPFPSSPITPYGSLVRNAAVKNIAVDTGLTLQPVGVVQVDYQAFAEKPHCRIKVVFLVEAEGTPSDKYEWKKVTELPDLQAREAGLLAQIQAGEVQPLSLIGDETGKPPIEEDIETAQKLVMKYQKQ